MSAVYVVTDSDTGVTTRAYGNACMVLTWRDGRGLALAGEIAETLIPIAKKFGSDWLRHTLSLLSTQNASEGDASTALRLALSGQGDGQSQRALNDLFADTPELLIAARRLRAPLYANIELTYRCNLRCRHCYVLHKVSEPNPSKLAAGVVDRLVEELRTLGSISVTLTGGEPTLVPRYREVISNFKDRGFLTVLKTNATTFNARRAELYAEDPAHETHVSLYGADAVSHDAFTEIQGSFRRTVEGLERLSGFGVRCRVNCTAWRGNVDQLPAMKILVERIGHYLVVDDTIWGRYNGDRSPKDLSVTRQQREQLLKDGIIKPFKPSPCTAGAVKIKVDAEGGVSTCELLPVTFGDVNEADLVSIWSSPRMSNYSQTTIEISDKRRLEGALALACPGLNLLSTGDLRG
jgi:MoaA/NifB/PqqE/SkfB family radical SAM enzyme